MSRQHGNGPMQRRTAKTKDNQSLSMTNWSLTSLCTCSIRSSAGENDPLSPDSTEEFTVERLMEWIDHRPQLQDGSNARARYMKDDDVAFLRRDSSVVD